MTRLHCIAAGDGRNQGVVIFVHGLMGNAFTTWGSTNSEGQKGEYFWPTWLAEKFPTYSIWSLDYDAPVMNDGAYQTLADRAMTALTVITTQSEIFDVKDPTVKSAPIAFVAHSLGGLLVKQLLVTACKLRKGKFNDHIAALVDRVEQVAFLATPHEGSTYATVAEFANAAVGGLVKWAAPMVGMILPDPALWSSAIKSLGDYDYLDELGLQYRNLEDTDDKSIRHLVMTERALLPAQAPLRFFAGRRALVVTPTSADPKIFRVYPVATDEDHISICKPKDREALVYKSVVAMLSRLTGGNERALDIYRQKRRQALRQTGAAELLFTKLVLIVDDRNDETKTDAFKVIEEEYDDLGTLIDNSAPERVFVVLGDPGCGKSTLLQKLELEISNGEAASACLSASLAGYEPTALGRLPEPADWLAERWQAHQIGNTFLPSWGEIIKGQPQRPFYILLDALNEMPHQDEEGYKRRVANWSAFIKKIRSEQANEFANCRFVFSCRERDYTAPLSELPVPGSATKGIPHVRILPLNDAQVRDFVLHYRTLDGAGNKEDAKKLSEAISRSGQTELYRTPFFLKMLIDHDRIYKGIPPDAAALFTSSIRRRLREAIESGATGKDAANYLKPIPSDSDESRKLRAKLRRPDSPWETSYELPDIALVVGLSRLAFEMQVFQGTANAYQVSASHEEAVNYLMKAGISKDDAEFVLLTASSTALDTLIATVVDGRTSYKFKHQLVQEYFAARVFAKEPDARLVTTQWKRRTQQSTKEAEEFDDRYSTFARSFATSQPLPPMKSTGWDETALLSAPMASNVNAYVNVIAATNLPLAGRAAARALGTMIPEVLESLRDKLLQRMRHPEADLRARIAAGKSLGEIGHPEMTRQTVPGTQRSSSYILPPTERIEGGKHKFGLPASKTVWGDGQSTHANERPAPQTADPTTIPVASFRMARYPVTNAEWQLFMNAGGYQDEYLWITDAARRWLRGETTRAARDAQWRIFRKWLRDDIEAKWSVDVNGNVVARECQNAGPQQQIRERLRKDWADGEAIELRREKASRRREIVALALPEQRFVEEHISRAELENWMETRDCTEDEFETKLSKEKPPGRYREPRRWKNVDFNTPLQPVVGICWFEAQAYCEWLRQQDGQPWRLPTEVEWEFASGHSANSPEDFPWAGAFPSDVDALADLTNTYETRVGAPTPVGLFQAGMTKTGLYDMSGNVCEWTLSKWTPASSEVAGVDDSAASGYLVGDDPRVLRGGGFYYRNDYARLAFRHRFHPGFHMQATGMRLICEGS